MKALRNILQLKQAYSSVNEMPIGVFLKILYGNMKEPKNWNQIFTDYQDLSKDTKQNITFLILKEVQFLANKVYIIEVLLQSISIKYNSAIADNLKVLIPKYSFSKENIISDLKGAKSIIKLLKLKLNEKMFQLADIKKKSEQNASKITDWDLQFVMLSKWQGYRLDPKTVTVSEYCNILNLFKEHIKSLENNKS